MTRQEMIREAASEYAGMGELRAWIFTAFETGADYADKHQKSPWVSVKDRLPKAYKYMPVIVRFETHASDGATVCDYSVAFLNGVNDWVAFGYNVQCVKINAKVTHWMPIPTLPEEGCSE